MTEEIALVRVDAVAFYPEKRIHDALEEWVFMAKLTRSGLETSKYYLTWKWLA